VKEMPLGFQDETKRGSSVTGDDLPALAVWSYGYSSCNFRLVTFSKNHPACRTEGAGMKLGWVENENLEPRGKARKGFCSFRHTVALDR
jgi:hypothetical protein